jgi:hypothetical protein
MRITLALTSLALVLSAPRPALAGTPGWGARSQVGQLVRDLDKTNAAAVKRPGLLRRQPLVQKLVSFAKPGLSVKDDVVRLERFVSDAEQKFGEPISKLHSPLLADGRRMRAEKAMALIRYRRTPSDVTEELVHTSAKVEGVSIADRQIFVQRWRPIGKPSGKVFVIAPGFLETGRNYYEQAQILNQQGHEVVIMDQQWAGYTADAKRGAPVKGGIDRGFGIARDVAEAAAYGNAILEREYGHHPGKQLVLVGTSMGGGPGVLGALALYDAGKIDLGPGRSIPADRGWILQDAFLGRTAGVLNNTLDFLGRIPGVRNLPLPAIGAPRLNSHAWVNAKLADHAVAEDMRGRPQAFRAALADILTIRKMVAAHPPKGRGYVIHTQGDYLANTKIVVDAVAAMQQQTDAVKLDLLPGRDHVVEETPGEQRRILDGVKFVGATK